ERLSIALAELSPDARAILSLRFDEDLTFREIAVLLDRPPSTVKSQLAKAIAQLRDLLGAAN
ncbi:MAG: sigma-70 family RNA polymerase sigma factor, partial [Planctomycetales bacterium]|nr:sigma-70 family RNA polymerase sigma factor [Planctomycetales bacterium]